MKFKRSIFVGVGFLAACYFALSPAYRVEGKSMLPTIQPDDWVLVNKWRRKYRRGDIVIAFLPATGSDSKDFEYVCKRIVGVEGDVVFLDKFNSSEGTGDHTSYRKIESGQVWLEGDNKAVSLDSRRYGSVSLLSLQGRVFCIIWPLERAKLILRQK